MSKYASYEQNCTKCGQPTGKTSRKEFCLCADCKTISDSEKSNNANLKNKWLTKVYCECCGKRIYGDISKGNQRLCEFCCSEFTAMSREYAWRNKPKEVLFQEILNIKNRLDTMEVMGMNIQDIKL